MIEALRTRQKERSSDQFFIPCRFESCLANSLPLVGESSNRGRASSAVPQLCGFMSSRFSLLPERLPERVDRRNRDGRGIEKFFIDWLKNGVILKP